MKEQLQARLEALQREFETGQAKLRELEAEEIYVRETLLRISGAIKVLEEVLSGSSEEVALKIEHGGTDPASD